MTIHSPTTTTSMRHVSQSSGDVIDQPVNTASLTATVATIMTRDVYCVRSEVDLGSLTTLLLDHDVSGLPVVDAEGHPVGIVSKTDVIRYQHEHREDLAVTSIEEAELLAEVGPGFHAVHIETATAGDVMMSIAFTLAQDAPIAKAAALMASKHVHRVPIVDGAGLVCGIVSSMDIVRWLAVESGYPVR